MKNKQANLKLDQADFIITNNKNGKPVIYKTNNPSFNIMTFTIKAASVDSMELKGGPPVKSHSDSGGSSFNFDFGNILSEAVVQAMEIDLPAGWAKKFFPAAPHVPASWSVAPTADMTLKQGEPGVSFTLKKITCNTLQPGNFEVYYYNIKNIPDSEFPVTTHIDILNPPDPKNKPLRLRHTHTDIIHIMGGQSFAAEDRKEAVPSGSGTIPVYITYNNQYPIENGFTLNFFNDSGDAIPAAQGTDATVVYVSFLFGYDDDSITDQSKGDNIVVAVKPVKTKWESRQHLQGTGDWEFLPESTNMLTPYDQVDFQAGNIITLLKADPGVSYAHVQFNNVPGYNDQVFHFALERKIAAAAIVNFSVAPTPVKYGNPVTLTWKTSLAYKVTLSYVDRNGTTHTLDSTKGDIQINETGFQVTPTKETTTFTLTAYKDAGSFQDREQHVTVIEPPAQIDHFYLSSTKTALSAVPVNSQVTLDWATVNAKSVYLGSSTVPATGTKQEQINQTVTFTLTAYPYGSGHEPAKNAVTVYAYQIKAPIPYASKGDGTDPQSIPMVFANPQPDKKLVYVGDITSSTVYQIDRSVSPPAIQSTYPGHILAINRDGSKLFVADGKGGKAPPTYWIIDTNSMAKNSIDYSSPPPCVMAVSPDGSMLFAAEQHNCSQVLVFSINAAANTLAFKQAITVGTSPVSLIFDKTGSKLYAANYDSQSVSVIDIPAFTVTTVALETSEPRAMAYSFQANKLYVACEGENYMEVIDTTSNTRTTKIQVGDRPFALTANLSATRIYAANFRENTVSVIDTTSDKVIDTLNVGTAPSALAFNNDGTILFVANYCDKSLSLIDTSQEPNTVIASIPIEQEGGNPLDLSVFPEANAYTDVYIAKENNKYRDTSGGTPGRCGGDMTGPKLDLSIISVQEKQKSS